MRAVWKNREVSKIHIVNTKMHSNFGHKNHYVSSIPNSFP